MKINAIILFLLLSTMAYGQVVWTKVSDSPVSDGTHPCPYFSQINPSTAHSHFYSDSTGDNSEFRFFGAQGNHYYFDNSRKILFYKESPDGLRFSVKDTADNKYNHYGKYYITVNGSRRKYSSPFLYFLDDLFFARFIDVDVKIIGYSIEWEVKDTIHLYENPNRSISVSIEDWTREEVVFGDDKHYKGKTLTFNVIEDSVAPSISVDSDVFKQVYGGKLIEGIFYSKSFDFPWQENLESELDGSGYVKVIYQIDDNEPEVITDITGDPKVISIANAEEKEYKIKFTTEDRVGNIKEEVFTYIIDRTSPMLDEVNDPFHNNISVEYNDDLTNGKFSTENIVRNFIDRPEAHVGLSGEYLSILSVEDPDFIHSANQNVKESEQISFVEGSDTELLNSPINYVEGVACLGSEGSIRGLFYDSTYHWTVTRVQDLLDNMIMVSESETEIEPREYEITFGRTRPPVFESVEKEGDNLNALIQLGKLYYDPDIGLSSIHICDEAGYEIGSYTVYSNGTIEDKNGVVLLDEIPELALNGITRSIPISLALPNDYGAHEVVTLSIYGEYHNGNDSSAAGDESTKYSYAIPNHELNQSTNDIEVSILNSQGLSYSTLSMSDRDSNGSTYYFSEVEPQGTGYSIFLSPAVDVEGDNLSIVIGSEEVNDVSDGKVVYNGNEPVLANNFKIRESYYEGDTFKSNDYIFPIELVADNNLILDGVDLVADIRYGTEGDYLDWSYTFPEGFEDLSGIQSIMVASPNSLDGTADDYVFEKIFDFDDPDNFRTAVPDASLRTFNGSFLLSDITDGTDKDIELAVTICDWAGNKKVLSPTVYYDNKKPEILTGSALSANPFLVSTDRDDDNSIIFSSFDDLQKAINIKLDCRNFLGNELCSITPSIAMSGYSIFGSVDTGLLGDIKEAYITISYSGTDIPSNEELTFTLEYEDRAGNSISQDYTVFTPLYLTESLEDYVELSDNQYDQEGHFFLFDKKRVDVNYDIFRFTDVNGTETIPDPLANEENGIIDRHNTPHEYAKYVIKGKNGSGYCYDNSGSYEDQIVTYEGLNISPVLTLDDISVEDVFESEGSYVLGPESVWGYTHSDPDGDSYTLKAFLASSGENLATDKLIASDVIGGISISSLLSDELSGSINFVENGEDYTLYLFLEDTWTSRATGEPTVREFAITEEGAEIYSFTYDNQAPELSFVYDKAEGFSYINGDISLSIVDEFAGLSDVAIDSGTSDSLEGVIELTEIAVDGKTHRISNIPDSDTEAGISLMLTDNIGNSQIVTIGPFKKDSVSPEIDNTSLRGLSSYGSKYYLNDVEVPISLAWSDETSGGELVGYRFKQNDVILISGTTTVLGSSKENTSWDLSCSFSGYPFNEEAYELEVQLFDKAGNGSDWVSVSDSLVFDTTAPVVNINAISGAVYSQGYYYINRSESPSLSVSVEDINRGSATLSYRMETEQGESYIESNLSSVLSNINIVDGEQYDLSVGAEDLAGNFNWSNPVHVKIDEMAPVLASSDLVYEGHASSFYSGGQFRFALENAHDDMKSFFVFLGEEVNGVFVPTMSELMTGHLTDGSVEYTYGTGRSYNINIPDVPSGDYEIRISAVDYAGNRGAVTTMSTGLSIDNTQGRVVVRDSNTYSNNSRSLRAHWEYKEGENTPPDEYESVNGYYYRVFKKGESEPLSGWTYTDEENGVCYFTESLTHGDTYFFEVYAVFDSGKPSNSGFSSGTILDLVDPVITAVTVPVYSTLSGLSVNWVAQDGDTSIGSVEALLEAYEYDNDGNLLYDDIVIEGNTISTPRMTEYGPYNLGSDGEGVGRRILSASDTSTLNIADGAKLFITLRVTDGAGNTTESYGGVSIKDNSAPPVPVVIDMGDYVNPLHNDVSFDWTHRNIDPESGEQELAYQILVDGTPLSDEWITIIDKDISLSLENESLFEFALPGATGERVTFFNGSYLRLALKATNGAGLSTVGYSNGVILDTSKPEIPRVVLGDFIDETYSSIDYLLGEDVILSLESRDAESDISSYKYEPVLYSKGAWISLGSEASVDKTDAGRLAETVPESLDDYDVLYYRATAFNNVGDASTLPGISNGAANYSDVPVIANAAGQSSDGDVIITWDVVDNLPLKSIDIELDPLFGSSYSVTTQTIGGTERSYRFENVPDGYYRISLSCEAVYGTVSDENFLSNTIVVDSQSPVISNFRYDSFVYETLTFSFEQDDALTGAAGYRYRVGTVGQPDLLTGGWIDVETKAAYVTRDISVEDDLNGGIDGLYSDDGVLLSVQSRDRSGNWSDISYSNPIIIDRTAPGIPLVEMDREMTLDSSLTGLDSYIRDDSYITSPSEIDNLIIRSNDAESGLKGYYWAIRKSGDSTPLDWSGFVSCETEKDGSLRETLSTEMLMEDDSSYEVYIRTVNRAGLVSETGQSTAFVTDFTAPVFNVDFAASGAGSDGDTLVFNGEGEIRLNDIIEKSDILTLEYSLADENGDEIDKGTIFTFGRENYTALAVPFRPEGSDGYGNYTMSLTLKDSGGFGFTRTQDIRFNTGPVLTISELSTNPMRPLDINLWESLYDADGVVSARLVIRDYQDQIVKEEVVNPGAESTFELGHPDSTPEAQHSVYTVEIEAVDSYGSAVVSALSLNIYNTSEGILYANEYWSEEHRLTGLVTVPPDLILTVAGGTEIKMSLMDEDNTPGLAIEEGATLIHLGSACYAWDSDQTGYWRGIHMKGTGSLNGITVRGAERGIVWDTDSVSTLENAVLEENRIGIHLLGRSPDITGCQFMNNLYYGVKEEGDIMPLLINNGFSGNGYDYYDSELTVLDGNDLTGINSLNYGNMSSGN